MHPNTQINFISPAVGVGVIAKTAIPKGTLVWVRDPLDRTLQPIDVATLPEPLQDFSLTYMYRNCLGEYVLLWDHGKYVNHGFNPNCMPTPYGFDIAIRDIAEGQELIEDYGLLNIIQEFAPEPEGGAADRGVVRGDDLLRNAQAWDRELHGALALVQQVPQPLWNLVPAPVASELAEVQTGARAPRSVAEMALR